MGGWVRACWLIDDYFLEPSTTCESSTMALKRSTTLWAKTFTTTWRTRCVSLKRWSLKMLLSITTTLSTAIGPSTLRCKLWGFDIISTRNQKWPRFGIASCGIREFVAGAIRIFNSILITFSSSSIQLWNCPIFMVCRRFHRFQVGAVSCSANKRRCGYRNYYSFVREMDLNLWFLSSSNFI